MSLLDKIKTIEDRYENLEKQLASPDIFQDREKLQKISKEHSDLKEIIDKGRAYRLALQEIKDLKEIAKDPEMKEMAETEIPALESKILLLEQEIEFLLLPKDPNDEKNTFIEIRAGTGGEEAALFAGELFRMYCRYAEKQGWKTEIISENATGLGGYKEIIFAINGKGAYSKLKYEAGTHRVQRVPATESGGRIHTSAVTVAVMPEAEDVDIKLEDKDLRIDTFRASGAGGQHVNKTSSAVRVTHIPTGVAVACQDERSQHQNKAKAMRLLKTRLFEAEEEKKIKARDTARKIMVGSGDRSEKIRTYNFPQSRITDHRINFTTHNLQQALNGEIEAIIDALISADRIKKLESIQ